MREDVALHRSEHHVQHEGAYGFEHWLSWFLGLGAIGFGVIGALVAFDVLSIRTIDIQGTDVSGVRGTGNAVANFQDGMLLILPGMALAFLAMTFHATEHHTKLGAWREGLWNFEHWFSYLGLLATIGLGTIGILVGFDVFDNGYTWRDGIVWNLLAILSGMLTMTMHTVGHHQYAYDEDDIRVMVEERVGRALERTGGTMVSGRGIEQVEEV